MLTPRRIQKVATLSPEASCSRKISSHSMIDRRVAVMRASSINVMGGKRNGIRGTAAGWGLWSAYVKAAMPAALIYIFAQQWLDAEDDTERGIVALVGTFGVLFFLAITWPATFLPVLGSRCLRVPVAGWRVGGRGRFACQGRRVFFWKLISQGRGKYRHSGSLLFLSDHNPILRHPLYIRKQTNNCRQVALARQGLNRF